MTVEGNPVGLEEKVGKTPQLIFFGRRRLKRLEDICAHFPSKENNEEVDTELNLAQKALLTMQENLINQGEQRLTPLGNSTDKIHKMIRFEDEKEGMLVKLDEFDIILNLLLHASGNVVNPDILKVRIALQEDRDVVFRTQEKSAEFKRNNTVICRM